MVGEPESSHSLHGKSPPKRLRTIRGGSRPSAADSDVVETASQCVDPTTGIGIWPLLAHFGLRFDPPSVRTVRWQSMTSGDSLFARFGKVCPAGTVLFEEGQEGHSMYVLQAGAVRITKNGPSGVKTLAVLGPGEFFGEMAILNAKPRTATAEVVEDARLLLIDAKTFEAMVTGNSEIAVRLIRKMARRLDSADELITILMHSDPKARVILGLSRQANEIGQTRSDGSVLVPLSAMELSREIGLEESETLEVIARLRRLRMVETNDEGFVISDVARLHEFLEFLELRERFGDAE